MFVKVSHILYFEILYFLLLDINECESNPCENGGTCMDMEDGYECECESGFTGPLCETGMKLIIKLLKFIPFNVVCYQIYFVL